MVGSNTKRGGETRYCRAFVSKEKDVNFTVRLAGDFAGFGAGEWSDNDYILKICLYLLWGE